MVNSESLLGNPRKLKFLLGFLALGGALVASYNGGFDAKEIVKNAKPLKKDSEEFVITEPADPSQYGIGTYSVGGIVPPDAKVKLIVDAKEPLSLTANAEGEYTTDITIADAGKHVFGIVYVDKEGKDVLLKHTIDVKKFRIDSSEPKEDKGSESNKKTDSSEPTGLLPDDDQSNVVYSGDKKIEPAKDPVTPTPNVKKPVGKASQFGISSHANFNVVPVGEISIGGKGSAGDKIMLLIDGKPSMKGTVKPNGRWSFPVKISKKGGRVITAQNLKTRKLSKIKLLFK